MAPENEAARFEIEAAETDRQKTLDEIFARLLGGWGIQHFAAMDARNVSESPLFFGRPSIRWGRHYRERRYWERDLLLRSLRRSVRPILWSAFERSLRAADAALFGEARQFGVVEGFTVPVRWCDNSLWTCTLVSTEKAPSPGVLRAAARSSQEYVWRSLELRDAVEAPGLTNRMREILIELRSGAKQKQVARVLGISERTVYNLMADARRKLGVNTTNELVRKAYDLGEID